MNLHSKTSYRSDAKSNCPPIHVCNTEKISLGSRLIELTMKVRYIIHVCTCTLVDLNILAYSFDYHAAVFIRNKQCTCSLKFNQGFIIIEQLDQCWAITKSAIKVIVMIYPTVIKIGYSNCCQELTSC